MCSVAIALSACGAPPAPSAPGTAAATSKTLDQLRHESRAVAPLVHTDVARAFVSAASTLPHEADDEAYYETNYGSPLAYARAIDVLGDAGLALEPGARILDFGYGGIGQLRMLAGVGFAAAGVDVDPSLRALYAKPGDQGPFGRGSVSLFSGAYPTDPAVRAAVGGDYRVVMSKNVLKRGYIHPDRPADDRHLIHLGVDDATFLGAVHDALADGGLFLLYNICPALSPPDKPFVPWSDGRSPFTAEQYASAGFEVLAFDRDDAPAIRALGHALAWDQGTDAMDLQNDLSVLYTLAKKSHR